MVKNLFLCLGISAVLTACSGADKSLCSQPKAVVLAANPNLSDLEDSVFSCIHSQAQLLSSAPGEAEKIADSVVYACEGKIANWRSTIENSNGQYAVAAIGEAYFEPTLADFRKSAIYRVTEARACSAD